MRQQAVSVVIPTNRGGPFLVEAVASVRAQTAPPAEIVLVDDGSRGDAVRAAAAALGIRYARQDAAGISAARNHGADLAIGGWIAFLDDDDVWHPERLDRQLGLLQDHPDAVACASGGWYLDDAGRRFGGWSQPPATSREMLSGAVPFPRITTLTVRASAYRALGGCVSAMEPAEDNDLVLRLLAHGTVVTVPEALVGYRRHAGNVSNDRTRGRVASDRVLTVRLRAAARRGDDDLAGVLRLNRRRFRAGEARDNLRDVRAALRRRSWRAAGTGLAWMTVSAPATTLAAVWHAVRGSQADARER